MNSFIFDFSEFIFFIFSLIALFVAIRGVFILFDMEKLVKKVKKDCKYYESNSCPLNKFYNLEKIDKGEK